jgi:hypothetical protein
MNSKDSALPDIHKRSSIKDIEDSTAHATIDTPDFWLSRLENAAQKARDIDSDLEDNDPDVVDEVLGDLIKHLGLHDDEIKYDFILQLKFFDEDEF